MVADRPGSRKTPKRVGRGAGAPSRPLAQLAPGGASCCAGSGATGKVTHRRTVARRCIPCPARPAQHPSIPAASSPAPSSPAPSGPSQPASQRQRALHCVQGVHSATPLLSHLQHPSTNSISHPSASCNPTTAPPPPRPLPARHSSRLPQASDLRPTQISILPSTSESRSPRLFDRSDRVPDTRTRVQLLTRARHGLHHLVLPLLNVTTRSRHDFLVRPHTPFILAPHLIVAVDLLPPHTFSAIHSSSSLILATRVPSTSPCRDSPTDPLVHFHDGRYRRVRLPLQGKSSLDLAWSVVRSAVTRLPLAPPSLLTQPQCATIDMTSWEHHWRRCTICHAMPDRARTTV